MGVATKIGEIAKKRGIPLKELSRRADIPYTTLYNAVKRDSKIDIETARKIAAALGISVLELDPDACERSELKAFNELISLVAEDEVNGNYHFSDSSDLNFIRTQLRDKWIPSVSAKYNVSPELLRAMVSYSCKDELSDEWSKDAIWPESTDKERARSAFRQLSNDWRKETAINWQIEILKNRFKQNYNNAVFEALMQLYQDNDAFTKELADRLEGLVYNLPPKAPAEK
jgi:lambda repressor-like predicted transcriptional regulator